MTYLQKEGKGGDNDPLFPNLRGQICTKEATASTIVEAAKLLGAPTANAEGKVTGHSLRVAGAQGMAAAGLDLWAIQLLGRWGSAAVQGYVREAHLKKAESWAQKLNESATLDKLTEEITKRVEKNLDAGERWQRTLQEATKAAGKQEDQSMVEALALEAMAKASPKKLDRVTSSEGIVHQVMLGPPDVPLNMAASVCGWRFGGRSTACLSTSEGSKGAYKRMCARCFGEEREELKGDFAVAASNVGL